MLSKFSLTIIQKAGYSSNYNFTAKTGPKSLTLPRQLHSYCSPTWLRTCWIPCLRTEISYLRNYTWISAALQKRRKSL